MSSFYTLLTRIGAAEVVNATAAETVFSFTHLVLGDGNGAAVVPSEAMTTLVREVHRVRVSSTTPDPNNPNWLIVEAVVPSTVGGWTVREIGLLGGTSGKLLVVGNFPETYKPVLSEGSGRDLVVRMIVQVGNSAVVSLTVDPSVAQATNQSIANAITVHVQAANPHPQYAMAIDLVQHLMAANPHPQYALAAALAAHLSAVDPHAQYYNAERLNAVLSAYESNPAEMFFRSG